MRFRIFYLLVLASLLGTPVLIHRTRAAQTCADLGSPTECAQLVTDPWWIRPAGLLSALTLGVAAYIFAQSWVERRREIEMLDAVGVHVREEDLPLEE